MARRLDRHPVGAVLATFRIRLVTTVWMSGVASTGMSVTDARIDQLLAPDHAAVPTHSPLIDRWVLGPLALLAYVVGCSIVMTVI